MSAYIVVELLLQAFSCSKPEFLVNKTFSVKTDFLKSKLLQGDWARTGSWSGPSLFVPGGDELFLTSVLAEVCHPGQSTGTLCLSPPLPQTSVCLSNFPSDASLR